MAKEVRKPFGYVAVTLIPTGIGFVMGGLLSDQPAFLYSGLGNGYTWGVASRDALLDDPSAGLSGRGRG